MNRLLRLAVAAAAVSGSPGLACDLAALTRDLVDRSFEVRARAARAAASCGADPMLVRKLDELLYEPASPVRQAAAVGLGSMASQGCVGCVKALRTALTNPGRDLRRDVVVGLAELGTAHLDLISAALKDDEQRVREAAILALVKMPGIHAVPAMATAAVQDADIFIRARALEGIADAIQRASAGGEPVGMVGGVDAALAKGLEDPAERVRAQAVRLLKVADPAGAAIRLANMVNDRSALVGKAVFEALGELGGERAVSILEDAMRSPELEQRRRAVPALARLGAPGLNALVLALGDSAAEIRKAALEGLPQPARGAVVRALVGRLEDPDLQIRIVALQRLLAASEKEDLPQVREGLRKALRDQEEAIQTVAVASAWKILGEASIELLEPIAAGRGAAQVAAVDELAKADSSAAAVALARILGNGSYGDIKVRFIEALRAKTRFAAGRFAEVLRQTKDVQLQKEVLDELGRLKDPRTFDEAVRPILADASAPDHLRLKAAEVAVALGAKGAVQILERWYVASPHLDAEAERALANAIGSLGGKPTWMLLLWRNALAVAVLGSLVLLGAVWWLLVRPKLARRAEEEERRREEEWARREREPNRPPTESEFLAEVEKKLAEGQTRPRMIRLLYQRGVLRYLDESYEAAATDLEEAIRRFSPDDDDDRLKARIYYFCGKAHLGRGDRQKGQRRLSDALKAHDKKLHQEVMGEAAGLTDAGPGALDRSIQLLEDRIPFSDSVTATDLWMEARGGVQGAGGEARGS